MAALDTNVVVDFLVRDDVTQPLLAEALLRRCALAGESLFVPITVALELEWVLPKAEVTKQRLTIRIGADALARWRASGKGWQTRVAALLAAKAP